jgi:hypothetical protein
MELRILYICERLGDLVCFREKKKMGVGSVEAKRIRQKNV